MVCVSKTLGEPTENCATTMEHLWQCVVSIMIVIIVIILAIIIIIIISIRSIIAVTIIVSFHVTTAVAQVGADLCMGSLIKNPGGTVVTGGGYVAGKAHLVKAAQARLTAPGVGMDAGCVPGDTVRLMMQGML